MLKLSFMAATMRITNIAAKTIRVTPTMPVTPELYVGVVIVEIVVFKPGNKFTPMYRPIAAL
jgi:hypothetical protein